MRCFRMTVHLSAYIGIPSDDPGGMIAAFSIDTL